MDHRVNSCVLTQQTPGHHRLPAATSRDEFMIQIRSDELFVVAGDLHLLELVREMRDRQVQH